MKWTKLRSSNDHDLNFSMFEMPWQGAIFKVNQSSNFKIKYLGSSGDLKKWRRKNDGATVVFENYPLKVVEVIVPAKTNHVIDQISSVVRDFLNVKLQDRKGDVQKYLNVINEAAKTSLAGNE